MIEENPSTILTTESIILGNPKLRSINAGEELPNNEFWQEYEGQFELHNQFPATANRVLAKFLECTDRVPLTVMSNHERFGISVPKKEYLEVCHFNNG